MNIRAMEYEFLQRVNKVDSLQDHNFLIPEIDLYLNRAHEKFIKAVAMPRRPGFTGIERLQRNTEDIRTLIVEAQPLAPTVFDDDSYYVTVPDDYMFYISSEVEIVKDKCYKKTDQTFQVQHDDLSESSVFFNSDFEWGEVNFRFFEDGIRYFTPDFELTNVFLNYVRHPALVHNARDFQGGTYDYFGQVLTGYQDSELPEHTHDDIVDLAAQLALEDILNDPNLKTNRVNQNFN